MNWKLSSRNAIPSMREPVSLLSAVCRIGVGVGGYVLLLRWLVSGAGKVPGLILAVLCAPAAGVIIATGLVAIFPALVRWEKAQHLSRWQGRYFAFDDRQIRIDQAADGEGWVVLADVMAVTDLRVTETEIERLGPFARRDIAEFGATALSETALLILISRRNYVAVNRFRLWLERDVLPPLHRRAQILKEMGSAP